MENTLKFKQSWFEILNKCSRELRTDVIEAVFQYYFTGAEPQFSDDARMIAFGFIRAEIDAARARSHARKVRKVKATAAARRKEEGPMKPPTEEEKRYLYSLAKHWNSTVKNPALVPIPISGELDADLFASALQALRKHQYRYLFEAIQKLRGTPQTQEFWEFFQSRA